MKTTFALVLAFCATIALATPTPAVGDAVSLATREVCNIPEPDMGVIDRIYKYARNRGVNSKVMLAMFETAAVETNYNNLPCGDQDSIGVFQQRPSQGWGSFSKIMDIEYATGKFLDLCIQLDKERSNLSTGQLAQAVQRSDFPTRYDERESAARKYLKLAIERNGGYSSGSNGGAINVGTSPGKSNPGSGSSGSSSSCSKTYTVKKGDTCSKISSKYSLKLSKFYDLNSKVNSKCTNLQVGTKYCVAGGSSASSVTKGNTNVPSNIAKGTTKNCKQYYTVKKGDVCSKLASKGSVSMSSFFTLNSGINKSSCNNLQVGKAYCISV
ncbi:hypothetical protein BKA62DRAFT_218908 [Auriculariales sp. MPI-PUGE-AT-0066]|nr:hypothetical protein BKA62DRAFT_218908 [Auriculariales sp. MPI-PUGE-AT-0066]